MYKHVKWNLRKKNKSINKDDTYLECNLLGIDNRNYEEFINIFVKHS